MRVVAFVPLALALFCGAQVLADEPSHRWYLGATMNGKYDGDLEGPNDNPLTGRLVYLPVAAEVGYVVTPLLGLHASAGLGLLGGAETGGFTSEVLLGFEVVFRAGIAEFGLRLDGGYSHLEYGHWINDLSPDAFVLEPKGILRCRLSPLWSVGVLTGLRLKWIVDDSVDGSANPQPGGTYGWLIARHF